MSTQINDNGFKEKEVDINDLYSDLKKWHDLQNDLVVEPNHIKVKNSDGRLRIISETPTDGRYVINPDHYMLSQMAQKLFGQITYLRTLEKNAPHLIAKHLNDWLSNESSNGSRKFLMRLYRQPDSSDNGDDGIFHTGRAFLSDSYKSIDNLPVFQAVVETVAKISKERNIRVVPVKQSLSSSNMFLRFIAPDFEMPALRSLQNYRNPETGEGGGGIATGFIIRNSEIGNGSLGIAPRFYVSACRNGLIYANEGVFFTHLGAKLETGVIQWSQETLDQNIRMIVSQVGDAVRRFISNDFLGKKISQIEVAGDSKLSHPIHATKNICKDLGFSESATEDTLQWLSNQGSAKTQWDVNQALTYQAQKVSSEDRWKIESFAAKLLEDPNVFRNYDQREEPELVPVGA